MKHIVLFSAVLTLFSSVAYTDFCKSVNHVAQDDVTYRPDPNVAPADLNVVPIEFGDIEVPLTAYLVQELGLNVPVSASKLGSVTIKENGQVIYNGKDISSNAQIACGKKSKKEIAVKSKKDTNEDRQVKVEAVKSSPLDAYTEEALHGGYGQEHINRNYND